MKLHYQERMAEVSLIMEEIRHHYNQINQEMYDQNDKSIQLPDFLILEHIEQFIIMVVSTNSELFRVNPQKREDFEQGRLRVYQSPNSKTISKDFYITQSLAGVFESYKFLLSPETYPLFSQFGNCFGDQVIAFYPVLEETVRSYARGKTVFVYDNSRTDYLRQHLSWQDKELINQVVSNFRKKAESDSILKQVTINIYKENNKKYKIYCDYFDSLFEQVSLGSSLTLVGLEFNIMDEEKKKNIKDYFAAFLDKSRTAQDLSSKLGYFGKWEYTIEKGIHFKIVLVFPSDKASSPKALVAKIADFWSETIVEGNGLCVPFNLTSKKASKLKSFHATIGKQDVTIRELVKDRLIGYIVKSEKYFFPLKVKQMFTSESEGKKKVNSITFRGQKPKINTQE